MSHAKEILSRKKRRKPTPHAPTARVEVSGAGELLDRLGSDSGAESLGVKQSFRIYQSDSDSVGRDHSDDAEYGDDSSEYDIWVLGDNRNPGRDADQHRLRPNDRRRQAMDDMEALRPIPKRERRDVQDGHRSNDTPEGGSGAGRELLSDQLGAVGHNDSFNDRHPSVDSGLSTDDCIHAMNMMSRYMDVCNALSDFPNATIEEIEECRIAWMHSVQAAVKSYYKTLDTLSDAGG